MHLVLELPPEEEAQFEVWAAQQGEAIQRNARALSTALANKTAADTLTRLFLRAVNLTQPVLSDIVQRDLGAGHYLRILLQTMTALYPANGVRPFTPTELTRRPPLQDAVTLYSLRVVSLGTAAQIANVSVGEFIEALSQAGVSVFQYGFEEVLAEVAEAETA